MRAQGHTWAHIGRALDIDPSAVAKGAARFMGGPSGIESPDGAIPLDGKNVVCTKPTDVWKGRFHSLKPNMGYPLHHLADQWGNSVETVREKAKRFGALRYVEDSNTPGTYVVCAVHPSTPKGK